VDRGADRNRFLPAADVHAAHDPALAVELALDAILDLAHELHEVEHLELRAVVGDVGEARLADRNGLTFNHRRSP
jgi:hypothetical protein